MKMGHTTPFDSPEKCGTTCVLSTIIIFSHLQVAELTREWVGKWKDIQKIIQVLAED